MSGCRNLTDTEISQLLSSFKRQRDRTLFTLGFRAGYRITELLSIKIKDVYQFGQVVPKLRVRRGNMKGKNVSREVPLHPEAREQIALLLREFDILDPELYLFKSRKGVNNPITRIQAHYILKDAVRHFELQGTVATHSFRKSFAKRLYEYFDHDLKKLQLALGHSDIKTTIVYLDPDREEVEEGILGV